MRKTAFGITSAITALLSIHLGAGLCVAQPASSPWPMFHHDAAHTGLSQSEGPNEGILFWSYITGHDVRSSAAIGHSGLVFVGSIDNRLYALTSGGVLSWSYATAWEIGVSAAIDTGGTIYTGSRDNKIYAIDSAGSLSWSYTTRGMLEASPVISSTGHIFIGSYDNRCYALTPAGFLSWSYASKDNLTSSPAIGTTGKIFMGSDDDRLYAFAPVGILSWSYVTSDEVNSSPSVGTDGTVFAGSDDNNLYSFSNAGSLLWSYATGGDIDTSPAITSDMQTYVGSWDNRLYNLSPSGYMSWSYETGALIAFSSAALDQNFISYVGSTDNNIYAIDSSGSLLWSYMTADFIVSSPSIGSDRRLYVGSWDNTLYCFLDPTAYPTPTPTPTPTQTPILNYINLELSPSSDGSAEFEGFIKLNWLCDFTLWDYRLVPVNIWLAAIKNPDPSTVDAPSSVSQALSGGAIFLYGRGMKSVYRYTGKVREPTWRNVSFPPAETTGTKYIPVPLNYSAAGEWLFATAFKRLDTRDFVRTDGFPVENSNIFSYAGPPSLLVSNSGSDTSPGNTVSVIDGASLSVSGAITVGSRPEWIARGENHFYVVNNDSGSVSKIGFGTYQVTATIPVGEEPFAACSNGDYVLVTNTTHNPETTPGSVSVIDAASDTVIKTIPVGRNPISIAYSSDRGLAVVTNANDNNLSVIDLSSLEVTGTISAGDYPSDVVFGRDNFIYVTNIGNGTTDSLSVIDFDSGITLESIFTGFGPTSVARDIFTSRVAVANSLSNTVTVLDELTGRIIKHITVGETPTHIAILPNRYIFVTNFASSIGGAPGTVSVINTNSLSVEKTIQVGPFPNYISY